MAAIKRFLAVPALQNHVNVRTFGTRYFFSNKYHYAYCYESRANWHLKSFGDDLGLLSKTTISSAPYFNKHWVNLT